MRQRPPTAALHKPATRSAIAATASTSSADAGALGCSLSGSGPSLFALCRGEEIAARVADGMTAAIKTHIGGEPQVYMSRITGKGARVLSCVS